MSTELLNRLATQRASCKHWCALLTTSVLLAGAIAKLPLTSLLWAAAPIFLLGLTEASYAGQEARCADALARRRGEGGGKDTETGRRGDGEWLLPEPAGDSLVRLVRAALSPAIWPFYLGMFAIVGFGAVSMNEPVRPVVASARSGGCGSSGCGSGGVCGSSGGLCGGNSSGKGCGAGCGGGSTATKTAATVNRPIAVPNTAPRPGFVPVNSVQVNRPNTGQPSITVTPQAPRQAQQIRPAVTIQPQNIPADGSGTTATGTKETKSSATGASAGAAPAAPGTGPAGPGSAPGSVVPVPASIAPAAAPPATPKPGN